MTTTSRLFLAALLIALAVIGWHSCESKKRVISQEPRNSEPIRHRVVQLDTTERAKFRKLAAERLTRIEALQRTLTAETGKRKQAEQKAANSAAEYAKNKTLANCHTALVDCQEENETKMYSLAVQERMLSEQDSLIGLQGSEIVRLGSVADTLSEGWRIANVNNADLDKQLQKEQNKLRVYATAAFEQHPINNNVKVGGTATHKNKLFSYDKGVLQDTHEFTIGFKIW